VRMLILPAVLATTAGLGFLPSYAEASWLSKALHQLRGDECGPVYASSYCPPAYAPSYGYADCAPDYYAPPVYRSYSYPAYSYGNYGYYPAYRKGWRGYRGYYGGYRGHYKHQGGGHRGRHYR
jgi:hypothetical protein